MINPPILSCYAKSKIEIRLYSQKSLSGFDVSLKAKGHTALLIVGFDAA